MSIEDIQYRLRKLYDEQRATTCARTKLIIKGERQQLQRQLDKLNGKNNMLGGIGSKSQRR